jgi:hypothetical protein
MNINDLLTNNKLAIKIVAALCYVVLLWLNRKFNLGMTKDDIQSAAFVDGSFIIGIALHKTPTPDAPDPGGTPTLKGSA